MTAHVPVAPGTATPTVSLRAVQHAFDWFIAAAGLALGVVAVAVGVREHLVVPAELLLLTLLAVAAEVRPILVPRRSVTDAVTTSAVFVFAILLQWGLAAAVLAQALASVIDDLKDRDVDVRTMLFNVGQYTLALGAASLVLRVLPGGLPATVTSIENVAIVAAAAVAFMLLNYFLPGIDIALEEGRPTREALLEDLPFHASVNGVVLALAPLVVLAAQHSPAIIALLLLPMIFVYRGAYALVEKQRLALHDSITGLPNRAAFAEHAERVLERRDMRHGHVAIVVIDVDDFKEVNDTLGHHVGDVLLRQIGQRLATRAHGPAFAARLGGDEFVLMLTDVHGAPEAEAVVAEVLALVAEPYMLDNLRFQLHASAGIAVFPDDGVDVSVLLQRADVAMYVAKRERTGFESYDPARDRHSVKRLTMMSELRDAIRSHSLGVQYQPQVDMRTGAILGVEALLRWVHPRYGAVPPHDYIALSEQTGVIRDVTSYVLATAMADLARWRAAGHDLTVAVNVSSRDLRDDALVEDLRRLLMRYDVPADRIAIEITESALVDDSDQTLAVLHGLRDLGVSLAVDDYGTGYASLAYLSRMPIDCIKIDRSFVATMTTVETNAVIVRSTINLARDLGFTVVAEGVENGAVWRKLEQLGCNAAQGFYVSRAVPPEAVTVQLDDAVTAASAAT